MPLRGYLNAWLTVVVLGLLLMAAFVYVMIHWIVPWLDTAMHNWPAVSDGAQYSVALFVGWWCD